MRVRPELTSRLSDRVVDALDAVAERARAPTDAGSDHVCLQVLTDNPGEAPAAQWRELATLDGAVTGRHG